MASNVFNFRMSQRPMERTVRQLILISVGAFVLELILSPSRALDPHFVGPLADWLGLSWSDVCHGMLWQFVTYTFLHGSAWHLFMNMLGLYFVGNEMERRLGAQRFLYLYLGCGAIGGVGWLILSRGVVDATCVGASGAIFGIIGAFAALFPEERFVLFPIPVPITARTLAIGLGVLTLVLLLPGPSGIAHAAHLAGGLAGYFYGRQIAGSVKFHHPRHTAGGWSNLRAWFRRRRYHVVDAPREKPLDWAAVDAVLDKIRIYGVNSLTRTEKALLDRASKTSRY